MIYLTGELISLNFSIKQTMLQDAEVRLENIYVEGVDTHARAASLRQWVLLKKPIRPIPIPILSDINFHAKAGDRVGIIGVNGCGKSSLLKVISGNYPIKSGIRYVKGSIAPLIEMGAGFDIEQTGRKNIKLTYAYRGRLKDYSLELEDKIIEFSEIGEKIDLPLKTYSSGMSARLSFSSAIFQEPDILLLDEVLATGDAGFVRKSQEAILDRINKTAITIIVSHDFDSVKHICNRFILMDQGKIITEDTPDEIMKRYRKDILKIG